MRPIASLLFLVAASLSQADDTTAASGVLHRLIGGRASAFHFVSIPKEGKLDQFKVTASQGVVTVEGSSGVAMARGAYTYLSTACHAVVTWDGDQVALPKVLPDYSTEVVCPNQYRHYFNVCTFGYTTAFWDWKRWQREIDWMALHGINMPLAMNGQEKVWQDVWQMYGINPDRTRGFFTGGAFLPWHRMGNVNSHAGPLPQDWIDRQAALQTQILAAERSLGMTPVTPAFSGFVPEDFQSVYPRANVVNSSGWAGFPPTHQLDARDPMFPAIQRRFLEAYRKRFGSDHLYLADLYNEMSPQLEPGNPLPQLKQTGAGIFASLKAADPEATWVMQGWLFHNDPFWKEPQIDAFLGGVPDDRMILLDLSCEADEIWRRSPAFRKKLYIWNLLHGFGGRTKLFGDLAQASTLPVAAVNDPNHGQMAGMGLTMEGIEQNSIVYELMCDSMWTKVSIDIPTWTVDYYARRYHASPEEVKPIADAIRTTFYTHDEGVWGLAAYQTRPGVGAVPQPSKIVDGYRSAVETLLAAPRNIQSTALYQRDLVDVTKRYVAEATQAPMRSFIVAIQAGDGPKASINRKRFDTLLTDLDALLETVPKYRMEAWIATANLTSGDTEADELNAREQVTVWGGPELFDYAAKEWGGLVRDFYLPRWDRFFDAYAKPGYDDKAFTQKSATWEMNWCNSTGLSRAKRVDAVAQAKKILAD